MMKMSSMTAATTPIPTVANHTPFTHNTIISDQNQLANCRWGEVILLDGRSVEILIQPRLFAGDLFDTVASHFDLREKEYFGLAFLDETGQYNWLNLERRVLEHEYAQRVRKRLRPSVVPKVTATNHNGGHVSNNNNQCSNVAVQQSSQSSGSMANGQITAHNHNHHHHHHNHHLREQPQPSITINNDDVSKKRLLTKSLSRQPNVSLIKSLKNKNQSKKSSSSSSMVNNFVKRPLARFTNRSSKSSTHNGVDHGGGGDHATPPTPPSYPPPPLPLILDTPEMIKVLGPTSATNNAGQSDDPVYDVIANTNGVHHQHNCDSSINDHYHQPSMVNGHHNHHNHHHRNVENNYSELIKPPSSGMIGVNRSSYSGTEPEEDLEMDLNQEDPMIVQDGLADYAGDFEDGELDQGGGDDDEEDDGFKDIDDDYGDEDDDGDDDRLVLYFLVKYFVESITMLQDTNTIELFYLQAKSLLINEIVQADLETSIKLSALILQSTFGDSSNYNETKTRNRIHQLQLISSTLLQQLSSYRNCEDHILDEYRQLESVSYGESIYRFMTLIEKQPTYGVHFYEVKDKSGQQHWLGLSFKGIDQFNHQDRRLPLKQFPWKQLENLYFREKKFSIEVRDLKRVVHTLSSINLYENAIEDPHTFDDLSTAICDPTTQVSVSRRTFGPCNVTVYVWFAATSLLTKCIWSMAIAQHQFYIDRRINKCEKFQQTKEDLIKCLNENHRLQRLIYKNNQPSTFPLRNSFSSSTCSGLQRNSFYSNASSIENVHSSSSSLTPPPPPPPPPTAQSHSNKHLSYASTNSLTNYTAAIVDRRNPSIVLNQDHQHQHPNSSSITSCGAQVKSSSLISLNLESGVDGNGIGTTHIHKPNSQTLLHQPVQPLPTPQQPSSSSSLLMIHRHTPFRHSTSASSIHKLSNCTSIASNSMSSSSSAMASPSLNNQRKIKMSKLRLLQAQLQSKMDELNRLDQLEQEIWSRASISQRQAQQPPVESTATTTTTTTTINCDPIPIPIMALSSSSSSSISSSTSSLENQNHHHKKHQPYTSKLQNYLLNPNSSTKLVQKAPNSLKNFVVTGRASSLSQQQQQQHLADPQHLYAQRPMTNRLLMPTPNTNHPPIRSISPNLNLYATNGNSSNDCNSNNSNSNSHQRSKSVGVSSRFSLDKSQQPPPQPQQQKRTDQSRLLPQTTTNQKLVNSHSTLQTAANMLSTKDQIKSTSTSNNDTSSPPTSAKHQPIPFDVSKQPLFQSPYVNKYDISVKSLLNDNDRTNLYSVPNQRTSVALKSLDDTVLHQKMANDPINTLMMRTLQRNPGQSNGGYSTYYTTSITSNNNTLTYSTVSYQMEPKSSLVAPISGSRRHSSLATDANPNAKTADVSSRSPLMMMEPNNNINNADDTQQKDAVDNRINHHHQTSSSSTAATRILGKYAGRNPVAPSSGQFISRNSNHPHPVNLDEENLAQYKSFLLRSNSFGSQRSRTSGSSGSNDDPQQNVVPAVPVVQQDTTINLNVNSDGPPPLPPPMNLMQPSSIRFTNNSRSNNCGDYVNLPPTAQAASPGRVSLLDQQHQQYNNHIYQNSQNLLKNLQLKRTENSILTSSKNPGSTNYNHNNQPTVTFSSARRPPLTKTWFETDLDIHHFKQNSSFKPLIRPSSNLLLTSGFGDDHCDGSSRPASSSSSTTIYHPIRLVTDDGDDDEDDIDSGGMAVNHSQTPSPKQQVIHQQVVKTSANNVQKSLLAHHNPPPSSASLLYQNLSPKRSSTVSPTPSQLSHTSQTSSGPNPVGSASLILSQSINKPRLSHSSSGSNSSLSVPAAAALPNNSSSSSSSIVVGRPPQPISPICTVAFVPPITAQTETVTTNSTAAATTVPIASCKGNIVEVDVVTVGHFQPGYEETKPFTMSDFYKYSQRYRQAQKNQQQPQQPQSTIINQNYHPTNFGGGGCGSDPATSTLSNRIGSLALSDVSDSNIDVDHHHHHHHGTINTINNNNTTTLTTTTSSADDNNNSVTTMVYS